MNQLTYIHPNAKIGENVTIGPFSTIYEDVEIGDGTWIAPNVTIMNGARIGKNCKIFPGAVISAVPQDLKFDGEESTVIIGDGTTIRECVTINRGTKANWETVVGKGCLLMAYVHIAHDCVLGEQCILANSVQLAGHIVVGNYANLGGMVAVNQFVTIGAHAYIAGASLVRKDVPPFTKAAREPLAFVGINSVGLSRRGYSEDQINNIHNIYRVIFGTELNVTGALEKVEQTFPQTIERDEILNFIKKSQRGIMKGYSNIQE